MTICAGRLLIQTSWKGGHAGLSGGAWQAGQAPVDDSARVQVLERQRDACRVEARLLKSQPPPRCLIIYTTPGLVA